MNPKHDKIIFHIDANSAFLSWTAVDRLQHGDAVDLRDIPSVVGGDPESRHGIVLAKSTPAKKFNILTGETLYSAFSKCPELTVVPPFYDLYIKCSDSMMNIMRDFSNKVQRFSIDECFLDYTDMEHIWGDPVTAAHILKDKIKKELGFTVNVGISNNKLLAKMASDLKKPDMVHTLFPEEMPKKMWPLPIEDLFMVGRATAPKLHKLNINTIGDLAKYDLDTLKFRLKSFGQLLHDYANGIDDSSVKPGNYMVMKGIGNSTTISFDVMCSKEAHMVLLSLTETAAMRLRHSANLCSLVAVSIRTNTFENYSRQRKLLCATDCTNTIYSAVKEIFDEVWHGEAIRHLGVRLSDFYTNEFYQPSLFEKMDVNNSRAIDKAIDGLRLKYGSTSVVRSIFLNSGIKSINGGSGADSYPVMSNML